MDNIFLAAEKARLAAREAYLTDLTQLASMEERLCDQHSAKIKAVKVGNARETQAQVVTIKAQLAKIKTSAAEAKQRLNSKLDAIDAKIVQDFKGLTAFAIGTGNQTAGVKYLFDTCIDFDKAKGNFEMRHALYDSVLSIAGSLADSLDK